MKKYVKSSAMTRPARTLHGQALVAKLSPLAISLNSIYRHFATLSFALSAILASSAYAATTTETDIANETTIPTAETTNSTDTTNPNSATVDEKATSDAQTSDNSALDVTKTEGITEIKAPQEGANSARTRPNFTPNTQQQASIERLKTYYVKDSNKDDNEALSTDKVNTPQSNLVSDNTYSSSDNPEHNAKKDSTMCYGNWVYPTSNFHQQQALEAAKTDKPNSAFPINAEADYGYYDNENYAELSGNVQINQGRQQISADKVVVNVKDGIAAAQGNVLLVDAAQNKNNTANNRATLRDSSQGGLITVANEVAYQTDSTKATAKDVAFASVPLQAYGYAKRLNKLDESHVQIDDVMFTTCAPDNPMWQINAKNIDVDTDSGRGKAYNATLKIKNTPVLYLPYFNFPIDDRRASGFLLPRGGFSSEGGLNVQLPYYFNLAPNYDATVTPTIFTDRNPMLTGEFRYLTKDYGEGNLKGSYLPQDRQYNDEDRKRFYFDHHWQSDKIANLSVDALYQYVSDSKFINDFETLGDESVQLNLPRRIQASYYNDYLTALAKVESFQTLDRNLTDNYKILDKDKPYDRLPQLSLKYRVPWITQLDVTGISDFAYFKRPINDNSAPEQSGGRLYNKVTAAYPISRTWGYLTPAVSLQHLYTQYDQETLKANGIDNNNKSQSVFVPEFSLDSGLNFFKAGSPFGKFDQSLGGYQLISPRLKYVYSPYEDQTDVPNFNTRLASLNFPQLYEDSWFLGYDRLPDNNHLTPSVNYRYIDANGLTRLDASVGEQIFFNDVRVHLDDTDNPLSIDNTGTVFQLSTQPRKDFWVDFDGSVSDKGGLNYYNAQLRYAPNTRNLYNLGIVRRTNNFWGQKELSAVTGSAIFPINDNWRFLGAAQYDNKQNRFSDVLAGFTYDSCCYGFSIYGRRYYNELDNKEKPDRAIMAEISLNGISNKRDGRLASLISNRVMGFKPEDHF